MEPLPRIYKMADLNKEKVKTRNSASYYMPNHAYWLKDLPANKNTISLSRDAI